jgi:phage terminase small subunit
MGLRGPPKTPTSIAARKGNPGRRPLPKNEPKYTPGVPPRPSGMSGRARKVWDDLVREMAASQVLRTVDALALVQLCEDQAMLDELRKGTAEMTKAIASTAKEKGVALPGGALVQLSRTIEGRRTLATIRELSIQVIVQRREFGLTPASNSRVEATGGAGFGYMDPLEKALCG